MPHDDITELKTDMKYVIKTLDNVDRKMDDRVSYCIDCKEELNQKIEKRIPYKVFTIIMGAIFGTIGVIFAVLKYIGVAIAAL